MNNFQMLKADQKVMKKATQGRKKIEIKKIDNLSNRQVTFSKRRVGLFKKACELCILTGAEVAIIVQSLGKRVFSFGYPSVDAVITRYTTGSSSSSSSNSMPDHHHQPYNQFSADTLEHKQHYARVSKELEAEKKRKEMIEESKMVNDGSFWWDEAVDNLGIEELEQYMASLEELKKKVIMRADELMLLKNPSAISTSSLTDMTATMTAVGCDDFFLNQNADQYCTSIVPYGSDF